MQALTQLLHDNADPSDTRYRILTPGEVSELNSLLACVPVIERMVDTYERRHPGDTGPTGLRGDPQ